MVKPFTKYSVSGRKVLDNAGAISGEAAKTKAELEYARYLALLDAQPRALDAEFENVAKQLRKPAAPRGKKGRKSCSESDHLNPSC
jgi:hypothetical protein